MKMLLNKALPHSLETPSKIKDQKRVFFLNHLFKKRRKKNYLLTNTPKIKKLSYSKTLSSNARKEESHKKCNDFKNKFLIRSNRRRISVINK